MSDLGAVRTIDVAFLQYALPPLMSGNFTLTLTHAVTAAEQGQTFTTMQAFDVSGERYSLSASDITSVFPPPGNQGEFANNVAHVVLSSPTLPWQRSPQTDPPTTEAGDPVPTWLSVLLFDENDPPPAPQSLTVETLTPTAGSTTFIAPQVPEYAQQQSDPVTAIDVPAGLFSEIAPSLDDLTWMAHVRQVDTAGKAAGGGPPPPVDYSVVFGNRLPIAGNVAMAYLVSLEGYADYLPGDDGTPTTALPTGTEFVRLVALHSWTFTALDQQQTFAGLLMQVSVDPPALQLPYDPAQATGDSDANGAVQNAFGMGYTAMNHALRDGDSTVSWYRGPLLPLGMPAGLTPATADPPWIAADQLVRYDLTTGMFDTSYAAAWQLGRLLALHDSSFSTALYRFKLTQTQAQLTALEQDLFDEQLPPVIPRRPTAPGYPQDPPASTPGPVRAAQRHARTAAVIAELLGPALGRATGASRPASTPPADVADTDRDHVIAWLTRLHLLEGVPFNYLVPDAGMLPTESIRFFQVDENWIEALLDGAYSIGFAGGVQTAPAQARPEIMAAAARRARSGRDRRERLAGARLRSTPVLLPAPETVHVEGDAPAVLSGLLLRSSVVSGWPGMEAHGYDSSDQPLRIVRMEVVAPSLLIVLFEGADVVARVQLQEPSEAIHFGVDPAGKGTWQKDLRYANGNDDVEVGSFITPETSVPVTLRGRGTPPIVPMNALANAMSGLVWTTPPPGDTTFTAAQFGLEMVEGVEAVSFQVPTS